MGEIIGAGIALAILAIIGTGLAVREDRKRRLPKDDGIVWNTEIEKRLHGRR